MPHESTEFLAILALAGRVESVTWICPLGVTFAKFLPLVSLTKHSGHNRPGGALFFGGDLKELELVLSLARLGVGNHSITDLSPTPTPFTHGP